MAGSITFTDGTLPWDIDVAGAAGPGMGVAGPGAGVGTTGDGMPVTLGLGAGPGMVPAPGPGAGLGPGIGVGLGDDADGGPDAGMVGVEGDGFAGGALGLTTPLPVPLSIVWVVPSGFTTAASCELGLSIQTRPSRTKASMSSTPGAPAGTVMAGSDERSEASKTSTLLAVTSGT